MKKIIFAFLVLVVGFSVFFISEEKPAEIEEKVVKTPSYRILETITGQSVGQGFFLRDNLLVTNNHILDKQESLLWNNIEFVILGRDSSSNIAFLGQEDVGVGNLKPFSKNSPFVGQVLYWVEHGEVMEGEVEAIRSDDSFLSFDVVVHVRGSGGVKSAGSPVFDEDGNIYGMIIASNPLEKSVVIVRIQDILKIEADMVGE